MKQNRNYAAQYTVIYEVFNAMIEKNICYAFSRNNACVQPTVTEKCDQCPLYIGLNVGNVSLKSTCKNEVNRKKTKTGRTGNNISPNHHQAIVNIRV